MAANRCRCLGAAALVAFAVSGPAAAQMISIPLGGPRPERPSPNAALRGAPADIAAAAADRGRPAAMRGLDEAYHPAEVLAYLGLSRGARVLVVERDPGYYGEIVGAASGGSVTELVPADAMRLEPVRATLSDDVALAPRLGLVAGTPATAHFAADSFDLVVLHLAYDRWSAPAAARSDIPPFVRLLFAAVRAGGIVGVVDGGHTDDDPPGAAVPDAADVKRVFTRAGFVLDNEGRVRGDDSGGAGDTPRFILKFRKPE